MNYLTEVTKIKFFFEFGNVLRNVLTMCVDAIKFRHFYLRRFEPDGLHKCVQFMGSSN